MKAGTLLFILHDVVEMLAAKGYLTPEGDFVAPHTVEQDLQMVTDVEAIVKHRGITVQDQVDKIIQALPLIFSLIKT